jgi:hypothetical protein
MSRIAEMNWDTNGYAHTVKTVTFGIQGLLLLLLLQLLFKWITLDVSLISEEMIINNEVIFD